MNPDKITQFLDEIEKRQTDYALTDGVIKLIAVARSALKFRYQRFGTAEKRCYTEQAKRELDKAFEDLLK